MSESIIYLQPAYILQQRHYRETSLIIDALTRDFGIVSLIAKGVRKNKSTTAGLLQVFCALKISYSGKNDLKLLTHVELSDTVLNLAGIPLYCGFYVNELVLRFLYKQDPNPDVFTAYQQCLSFLSSITPIEQVLRFFELNLLQLSGYEIQLDWDTGNDCKVDRQKKYLFISEFGLMESENGYIWGKTLLALAATEPLDKQGLAEAKRLMRSVIDFYLQGKELKSRKVLAQILKKL